MKGIFLEGSRKGRLFMVASGLYYDSAFFPQRLYGRLTRVQNRPDRLDFNQNGAMDLLKNRLDNKEIDLKTSSRNEYYGGFSARSLPGYGKIRVESDLTGLKK